MKEIEFYKYIYTELIILYILTVMMGGGSKSLEIYFIDLVFSLLNQYIDISWILGGIYLMQSLIYIINIAECDTV